MSSTLVRNSNTYSFVVENPSIGAGKADLLVPVPGSTSKVHRLNIIRYRVKTLSVNEVISLVASGTVTIFSVCSALISNWYAYSISIEGPSLGTSKAYLVFPVPGSAS